jgi:hypothetical protein
MSTDYDKIVKEMDITIKEIVDSRVRTEELNVEQTIGYALDRVATHHKLSYSEAIKLHDKWQKTQIIDKILVPF